MKNRIIAFVVGMMLLLFSFLPAQITFERWYGGTSWDGGYSVAQTSDGGYIVAGWTESYGAGSQDVFLIKTDSIGDTLWTRTYGGVSIDWGNSVAQTSDGGFIITGETWSYGAGNYDVYLIKTDSIGDTLWTRTCGGTSVDWGNSVAQTSDDGYIVGGYTWSFGAGITDVYLIKTDSLGIGIQEEVDKRQVTRDVIFTCHPNPFTISTSVQFLGTNKVKKTTLTIYDASGRRVREISLLPFSFYLGVTWDGRDDDGKVLPPGIYFLKLNGKPVGKVVKVR